MMNFNSNTHSRSLLNRLKVRGDIREDKETNLIKSDVNKGSSSTHSYRKHLTRSDKKMSHHWRLKLINCFIIAVQLLVTQQWKNVVGCLSQKISWQFVIAYSIIKFAWNKYACVTPMHLLFYTLSCIPSGEVHVLLCGKLYIDMQWNFCLGQP